MGGYTAQAVAGGTPWNARRERIEVYSDPRVKALVLLAPATAWFTPDGSLQHVTAPILMLTADHDGPFLPPGWHEKTAGIVLSQTRAGQVKFRTVENSGHMSFLIPLPDPMISPDYPPSVDPEGFDRVSFHQELNRETLDFLSDVTAVPCAVSQFNFQVHPNLQ
jgi:predicted dienelactone hydrolase